MLQKKIAGYILDLKQKLGKGAYGEVYLAVDTSTNKFVAVKQIGISQKNQQQYERTFAQIQNEVKIMKAIVNNNVVSLLNVQRTPNNLYLVMEYCNQGTLEEYIRKKCEDDKQQNKKLKTKLNYLSEKEATLFIKQIINGFRALYQNKIVHRDLKLQNILISDGEAKIADFGFSKVIECGMEEPLLRTYAGSPLYMSIQILQEQQYSSKCDIWSLGVIFYEILFGSPPWIAVSIPDLIYKISNVPIKYPDRPFISLETKTLITKMLVKEEFSRISWEELFNHPYFSEKMEMEEEMNLKATVSKLDGQYKNDGLRRSNAKKKLYFDNNNVIQNVQHAARQQQKMQKIFDIPPQSPQNMQIEDSFLSKNPSDISQQNSNVPKNRIFENRKDRSVSPNSHSPSPLQKQESKNQSEQVLDGKYLQIFKNNQVEQENKKAIQRISEWIIHRRNKSVFMNTVSQKWFDLYDSGSIFKEQVSQATYYRFLFVLTKYQTIIFFKMNCRLESKKLEKTNKFTSQNWSMFVKSTEYKTTANQIRNDFYVVRGFLIELIDKARDSLELAIKQDQNGNEKEINKRIFLNCNMDLVEKQIFDPIFFENVNFILQIAKKILQQGVMKIKNQEELQIFANLNRDVIIFASHLNNALRIKEIFRFDFNRPVDFFKYYEEIDNENPLRLAHLLGVL